MKKLLTFLLVAFGIICFPGMTMAAPFLTCDNYPLPASSQPDSFEITITPLAPFTVAATTNADGTVKLWYDLGPATTIGAGAHNASAVAIKNGWRSGVSNVAPFTKPTLSAPNISIVGQ